MAMFHLEGSSRVEVHGSYIKGFPEIVRASDKSSFEMSTTTVVAPDSPEWLLAELRDAHVSADARQELEQALRSTPRAHWRAVASDWLASFLKAHAVALAQADVNALVATLHTLAR